MMPTLLVHRVMTSTSRVLRRLASNAITFELERQMSSLISSRAVPESLVVYRMKTILSHVQGRATTEPIVRAEVTVDTGADEPELVPFFDIRLRDWLCLDEPELLPGEEPKVSWQHTIMSDVLVPDENSPES